MTFANSGNGRRLHPNRATCKQLGHHFLITFRGAEYLIHETSEGMWTVRRRGGDEDKVIATVSTEFGKEDVIAWIEQHI